MDLPEGFHKEVIEARESNPKNVSDIKDMVSVAPLKSGGASFKTNVIIEESNSKLIYKPSIGVALFCFIFLAVGLGVLFFGVYLSLKENSADVNWFLLLFGLIFTIAASLMFYYFYKPRVFDKYLGLYYSAYKIKLHKTDRKKADNYIPLQNIIAIQIIGEHISSDNGSYKSFELNLVLDDKSRRNVVDHGNLKSIINDAHIISDYLNIPIWHAKTSDNK